MRAMNEECVYYAGEKCPVIPKIRTGSDKRYDTYSVLDRLCNFCHFCLLKQKYQSLESTAKRDEE